MKRLATFAFLLPCLLLCLGSHAIGKELAVEVSIDVPNPGWKIEITSMHVKNDQLLVVCEAKHNGGINAQVITKATAKAMVDAKHATLPRQTYLLDRGWSWGKGYKAVTSEELKKVTVDSEKIYEAKQSPKIADFVGLTLEKAQALAKEHNLMHRVVMVDGKPRPTTRDFRPERLNFTVEQGKVTKVTKG